MPLSDHAALRKDRWNSSHVRTLQHRHYAVIAGIIAGMPDEATREASTRAFATVLRANPRFDVSRFVAACAVEPAKLVARLSPIDGQRFAEG